MKSILVFTLNLLLLTVVASRCDADDMGQRISAATGHFEKKQGSMSPIPQEILANAKGIAFATITKGGLGIGGLGGEGIVFVHRPGTPAPSWTAPSAFNISGGSLGAQIGFSSIKYIMVLNTDAAVRQFTGSGKMKWDATAMGTAGNDTGIETENTRDLEQRAILVYTDSGGLFGGATFGSTVIETKDSINQDYYGAHVYVGDLLSGKIAPPKAAARLYQILNGQR